MDKAALDQIEEALEPFAKLAEPLVDRRAPIAIGLTDDDFIRARAALSALREAKEDDVSEAKQVARAMAKHCDERIASLESRERKLREAAEPELTAAVKLLLGASIASCTCNTKSHELLWHDPGCRYVTLSHALERIEQAQVALADPQGEGKP